MAPPPPASGSGDSDWSDNDDEKVAMDGMECFYGLVRDATRSCSYGMHACPPLLSISISLPTSTRWLDMIYLAPSVCVFFAIRPAFVSATRMLFDGWI
jgi:hypothetical protein